MAESNDRNSECARCHDDVDDGRSKHLQLGGAGFAIGNGGTGLPVCGVLGTCGGSTSGLQESFVRRRRTRLEIFAANDAARRLTRLPSPSHDAIVRHCDSPIGLRRCSTVSP